MKSHEDPFEEMMQPAQLFIFGFLFLIAVQMCLEALPATKAWLKRSQSAVKDLKPIQRYPERVRIRIYFELAQAAQRSAAELKTFSHQNPGQTGVMTIGPLKQKYEWRVGKKYRLSPQELEAIRLEGLSKGWLNLWPTLTGRFQHLRSEKLA